MRDSIKFFIFLDLWVGQSGDCLIIVVTGWIDDWEKHVLGTEFHGNFLNFPVNGEEKIVNTSVNHVLKHQVVQLGYQ